VCTYNNETSKDYKQLVYNIIKREGKGEGGGAKGKGGESVPLALILQFDHCTCVT